MSQSASTDQPSSCPPAPAAKGSGKSSVDRKNRPLTAASDSSRTALQRHGLGSDAPDPRGRLCRTGAILIRCGGRTSARLAPFRVSDLSRGGVGSARRAGQGVAFLGRQMSPASLGQIAQTQRSDTNPHKVGHLQTD